MSGRISNAAPSHVPSPASGVMRAAGQSAVREISERTARSLNLKDQPAKPLNATYAKRKPRIGASDVRNLRLTGLTMSNFGVIESRGDHVTIGFTDARAAQIAARNNEIEPMVGLSPTDSRAVVNAFKEQYLNKLRRP